MNEILTGGYNSSPVREGETVVRAAGPWTPSVHALLRHLRSAGFDQVPEPISLSSDGSTETLGYVEGTAGTYPLTASQRSDSALVSVASTIRAMHDASVGFGLPVDSVWQARTAIPAEIDCIGHNDLGPYNMVFSGTHVAAIIDWDFAAPSSRAWDLCYAAHRFVPLSAPVSAAAFGFDPLPDQAARLALFAEAYGGEIPPGDLIDLLLVRLASIAANIEREVRFGNPAFARQRDERHGDAYRQDIAYILQNRDAWLA